MESVKNSVFASLFNNKDNVLRMYKELKPETRDLKPEDIFVQKVEKNIFCIIVNDSVVLIALQNKWNPNLALLMMFTYTKIIHKYIRQNAGNHIRYTR